MRRFLIASVLFILTGTPAFCQIEAGTKELSPTVGGTIPLGDFNKGVNVGFALGVQLSYYVSPQVAIGGTAIYNSFGVNDLTSGAVPGVDLDINIFELTGHLKFVLGRSASSAPYVKGFAGLFATRASASASGITASTTETDFGFGGGLGYQFEAEGNVWGFAEVVIVNILTDVSSTQYATVRGGISYFLGENN